MSKNPAFDKMLPLLSPYVDGELTPEERQMVEQHLAANKESAGQVADFRAGDALIRHALEMQGDSIDWKGFTDDVMSKVVPEKLPLFERIKLSLSEMFTYQRGPMLAGFAGAAVPLVMETDTGDAIIWVVESNNPDGGKKKKDGESSEETLTGDPEGNQGDL
jgi:anti-sigma factor RsiW